MNPVFVSATEENYLKAIYKLAEKLPHAAPVNTTAIARSMNTRAASVTDMVKRLAEKDLLSYQKYKGVLLTHAGSQLAKKLLRKHRLWEAFLVEKLHFKWDEVHDIAEQLEHIQSPELTNRLDAFLNFPKFDPHGDPIPDEHGNLLHHPELLLSELKQGETATITGVLEHATPFLQYLEARNLKPGATVTILQIHPYDQSVELLTEQQLPLTISKQVSQQLYVKKRE